MSELLCKINSLAIFKGIRDVEPLKSFCAFLVVADDVSETRYDVLDKYTAFVNELYKIRGDGDLASAIWVAVKNDDNAFREAYIKAELAKIKGKEPVKISHLLRSCVEKELAVINEIALTSYADVERMIAYDGYVAQFKTTGLDIKDKYLKMLEYIGRTGYGMYADYMMFKVMDGRIVPMKAGDSARIDKLYGYDGQRELIINNTKNFIKGEPFFDVLIFGESGTGKSSTVRAVARLLATEGVRLVEMSWPELDHLSAVIDELSQVPMRFILLLDDISFDISDARTASINSVLRGGVTGARKNTVIYLTSSKIDRDNGFEIFGMKVAFDRPEKDEYLGIAQKIIESRGMRITDYAQFESDAEQFAVRAGGRSARCARQFADQYRT